MLIHKKNMRNLEELIQETRGINVNTLIFYSVLFLFFLGWQAKNFLSKVFSIIYKEFYDDYLVIIIWLRIYYFYKFLI